MGCCFNINNVSPNSEEHEPQIVLRSCYCGSQLERSDCSGLAVCFSCYRYTEMVYQYRCTAHEDCIFKQIAGEHYVICFKCSNLSVSIAVQKLMLTLIMIG